MMKPAALYVSSSPCLLPPSVPALIFTQRRFSQCAHSKMSCEKVQYIKTAKACCYLNTPLISQIIRLHTGTSVVVINMCNGGVLVRKRGQQQSESNSRGFYCLNLNLYRSDQKSGTMRVSLWFSNQMSLQLGHRRVSLKHQKQMGRKKDYK